MLRMLINMLVESLIFYRILCNQKDTNNLNIQWQRHGRVMIADIDAMHIANQSVTHMNTFGSISDYNTLMNIRNVSIAVHIQRGIEMNMVEKSAFFLYNLIFFRIVSMNLQYTSKYTIRKSRYFEGLFKEQAALWSKTWTQRPLNPRETALSVDLSQ